MKITKTTTSEFDFDFDAEVKRLEKNFKGDQLQRQLSILNHFKNGDFVSMSDEYDNLPYDDEDECSEKEYTGLWCAILFGGWNEYSGTKSFKLTRKTQSINNSISVIHHAVWDSENNN
jgi:hypothetical protein